MFSLVRVVKLYITKTLLLLLFFAMAYSTMGFPGGTSGKESACNAGNIRDVSSIPGLGKSPGGEHGNPLQYSYLENNPMDKGAW